MIHHITPFHPAGSAAIYFLHPGLLPAPHTRLPCCLHAPAHRVCAHRDSTNLARPRLSSCSSSANSDHWLHTSSAATAAAACLCCTSLLAPPLACASTSTQGPSTDNPLYDGAGIVARDKQAQLSDRLVALESATGWRVRALTYADPSAAPSITQLREAWRPDKRTVIIQYDPSSPNIIAVPYIGDEVLAKLRRPFWSELQTRFGNMFYIQKEGEQAAVTGSLTALIGCLEAPRGCSVVPGLPEEQYFFTLGTSIAGGLVAGFVSRLKPQGFVQRRWVWLLLFSPLWGSLFINFGLGPIISRTADLEPVAYNCLAFAVAACAPWALTQLGRPSPPSA